MIKFYLVIFFLLFFPVLDLSGHFISIQEFYLYGATFLALKDLKKNPFAPAYLWYFIGFFFVIIITSLIAQTSLNNHDMFNLRNCAQSICAFFLFDRWFRLLTSKQSEHFLHRFVLSCFIIVSLPCLLVYVQRLNLLGARDIVISLYKPQFHFLGSEQFAEYRYTSIFKDFFTFACYSIILCTVQFYCLLKLQLKGKARLLMLTLLILNYLSQFYVARTSILLIPFLLATVFILFPNKELRGGAKRKVAIFLVIMPVFLISLFSLFYFELVNAEWISSGLSIFSGGSEAESSFNVMQEWNIGFFNYLMQNPGLLFMPKHSYDLTVTANPALYTDSFYAQEIYRYGIYGMLLYLIFVVKIFKASKRVHFVLALFVIAAVLLNYKGGNVFFMHKNSYLYPFFFSLVLWITRWGDFSRLKERTFGDML